VTTSLGKLFHTGIILTVKLCEQAFILVGYSPLLLDSDPDTLTETQSAGTPLFGSEFFPTGIFKINELHILNNVFTLVESFCVKLCLFLPFIFKHIYLFW